MGIFAAIMDKIFHHPAAQADAAPAAVQATPASTSTPAASTPAQPAAATVDVEAVLTEMASQKGGGGHWQSSIVDLLKLLDLDSSLGARKQLADELDVHTGEAGSAEENIALHQTVMQKLADNGGKVPDSLKG